VTLRKDDCVIGMVIVKREDTLLTVTEKVWANAVM